jgi:glycosyltransferase involved in cell wall biosynthesis
VEPAPAAARIAVVIPCYNEALTIAAVVEDFARELPGATVYVFDNNSSDGSGEIAARAGARVVRSPVQGKGNVIRHMASTVDADVYVLADGDGTYPPAAVRKMIERLQDEELDMLVGTRLAEYEPGAFRPFHRLGNRAVSGLISLLFRARLSDVLSGYRVLSRSFVDLVRLRTPGFEVETEMTLQCLAKRLRFAEMPVPYGSRPAASPSKLDTWSDGFLILKCIVLIFKDYKPFVFFAGLAALLAAASLAAGVAPVADYLETGQVRYVPRAILAAGLGILASLALTVGLILDTIARYHEESIELWKRVLKRRP